MNLSQFVAQDKPSWLTDYNSDMQKIDAGVGRTSVSIANLSETVVSKADKTRPASFELELLPGFEGIGANQYWMNAFNEVTVVFSVKPASGNFFPGATVFAQLPAGFRPAYTVPGSGFGAGAVPIGPNVDANGALSAYPMQETGGVYGTVRFIAVN